jgi:hypothetical protein
MKKTYIAPGFVPEDIFAELPLAGSVYSVIGNEDHDISYGGVDDGTHEADVKSDVFDFNWE